MVDERPEETELPPDSGRPKREPPTIDLEASEISGTTVHADSKPASPDDHPQTQAAANEPSPPTPPRSSSRPVAAFFTAMISGGAAAALVIGAASYLGWTTIGAGVPGVTQTGPAPQLNAAAIDDLSARLAKIEKSGDTKSESGPNAPASESGNAADGARLEALEKSVESLRGEMAGARANPDKSTDASPGDKSPPVDLSPINDRIAKLEQAVQAGSAELAKQSAKAAEARTADAKAADARMADVKAAAARPADDMPLRRVVIASVLDISVRQGEPYAAALAAAKSLTSDAEVLKPLEGFASTGVPTTNTLSRELLTLVPKLSPSPPQSDNGGIIDRLQAGAARLVRIERTDAVGNDRSAIVARVMAAALRNDSAEARRELKTLSSEDRAAAQSWVDKTDARDAALAASRQFSADAMAALTKPSQ